MMGTTINWESIRLVVFDVDGTLVTTNLVHPTVFYMLNQPTPL